MKNLPEKIYLNLGIDDMPEDFNELHGVSWADIRINKTDPCYVREDVFYKKLLSKLHQIESGDFTVADYIEWIKDK